MRTIVTSIVVGKPVGLATYVTEAEAQQMRSEPSVNRSVLDQILILADKDAQEDERWMIAGGSEALRRAGLNQPADRLAGQEQDMVQKAMDS
jgi:hypothetical protein